MSLVSRSLTTVLLAAAISAGVALLPLDHFGASPAWPHGGGGGGGGGGNGNGNGGGHGNGNGGGAALGAGSATGIGASASAASAVDPGHHGKGTSGSKGGKGSTASKGIKGSTASTLGALNAAHASPNALAHASPNSRVGKIAAYKDSVAALNTANANLAAAQATLAADIRAGAPAATITADQKAVNDAIAAQATAQANTAQALANAANKSISTATVVGVDNLLGVSLSAPTTAADLASQAAALQTKH